MAEVRRFIIGLAIALAILVPAWFVGAALLTKFGVVDWRLGFGQLTLGALKPVVGPLGYAPIALLAGAVLALIGLVLAFAVTPRRGRLTALVALLIPAALIGWGVNLQKTIKDIPPLHDISTDLADPPGFSKEVLDARAKVAGGNPLELQTGVIPPSPNFPAYANRKVVEVHAEAYGDLKPMISDVSPTDIVQIVTDAATAQGWKVTRTDAVAGVIEAQVTSFWFGFVDDISIRIRPLPDGTGSVIDVRSVSRVGLSDLGANAKRVRAFQADLAERLNNAATG